MHVTFRHYLGPKSIGRPKFEYCVQSWKSHFLTFKYLLRCTRGNIWSFFHVQIHHTDYAKPRRIVTMTPNKLIVSYILWPISLWPILIFCVADMVFCCGRYRLAVADMVVADMVCGRYGRTPTGATNRLCVHRVTNAEVVRRSERSLLIYA